MIVDYLIKIIYYKSIKITINTSGLVKVIINMIVYYHDIPMLIVINQAYYLY